VTNPITEIVAVAKKALKNAPTCAPHLQDWVIRIGAARDYHSYFNLTVLRRRLAIAAFAWLLIDVRIFHYSLFEHFANPLP